MSDTPIAMNNNTAASLNPIDKAVRDANTNTFINGIRIVQGSSKLAHYKNADGSRKFQIGDFSLGSGEMAINLGDRFKAIVGPQRYAARSFENESLVEQAFNFQQGSTYDPVANSWNHPGMSQLFSKLLTDSKKKQVFGQGINTMVGYDVLLYIPDFQVYGVLFLAKTALSMSNIFDILKANKGRYMQINSALRESKSATWYVPEATLITNSAVPEFVEDTEQIKLFLFPNSLETPMLPAGETAATERPR